MDQDGPSQVHTKGLFLEKPGLLKDALEREVEWANNVPGYDSTMKRQGKVMSSLERSLSKLNAERELGEWAGQFIDPDAQVDDGTDGNQGKPIVFTEDSIADSAVGESDEDVETKTNGEESRKVSPTLITNNPCITSLPAATNLSDSEYVQRRKDAVLVMIRHGKTEHNKLKLFTGWEGKIAALSKLSSIKFTNC